MTNNLRINPDRMLASFNELAEIGSTGDGGVNRPSLSEAHLAARRVFADQIKRAGLESRLDGAGNHSGILPSKRPNAKTLLLGSHLDSVPHGGRFDGALGVVAALEVLRTIKDAHLDLNFHLEAIDFTDEEGTLVGLLGSAALTGHLTPEMLKSPRGGRDRLVDGMKRSGLSDESILSAVRSHESMAGYLELHIEQGKRLERTKIAVGIVTAIVGISSYRYSFLGRADHAGSTTMDDRLDASLGASAFTLCARELVMKEFPDCVVNVGKMEFAPGAFNIVPAKVDLALEFRAPDEEKFARLDSALIGLAKKESTCFGLELTIEFLGKHFPAPMHDLIQHAFSEACDELSLTHMPLASGAGHDGQSFAGICPMGMIFVPSMEGASHSPREYTAWQDCVNGANVLLQAVLKLAA